MKVTKKVYEDHFQAIIEGTKTFEMRPYETSLAMARELELVEIRVSDGEPTGRSVVCEIEHWETTENVQTYYGKPIKNWAVIGIKVLGVSVAPTKEN